jgi:hypothetical protein
MIMTYLTPEDRVGITEINTGGRLTARQLLLALEHLDDEQLDCPVWLYGQTEVVKIKLEYSHLNKRTLFILEGKK